MNWDQIKGHWRQASGRVKSTSGKATDDDAKNVAGKRRMLIGALQTRYGVLKEGAEKQLDGWVAKVSSSDRTTKSTNGKTGKSS